MATWRQSDNRKEHLKTSSLLNGETKVQGAHKLPMRAYLVYKLHGVDVNDNVITVVVLRCHGHRKRDRHLNEFYLIQFREVNRVIDRNSRKIRQFSGINARNHMNIQMIAVARVLEESRIAAAGRIRNGKNSNDANNRQRYR